MDVDGAVCRDAGATADCPSGQACGNDGRCSERAGACLATRCTPGPVFCASPDGAEVEGCSDADSVCGARVPVPCWGTLGAALSAAAERARATGGTIEVAVHARGAGEAIFGVATGETFPVEVPADVALVGSTAPGGAAVLRAESAATILSVAGTVQGLRVESAGASGTGISVACGASGTPSLVDVAVEGSGALATGVIVDGGDCGAALVRVDVSSAVGPALSIASSAGTVTVRGGRYSASGTGIRLTGGKLTVGSQNAADAVEVSENAGDGIVLDGAAGAFTLDATIERSVIFGNGGTGLVLDRASGSSMVTLRTCEVYANGDVSPRSYGPAGARRVAGGVFVRQGLLTSPSAFTFEANRVFANARTSAVGDQLAFETSTAWSIAPASCASANVFACVGTGHGVSVAGGGTVDARLSVWPDVVTNWVSAGVDASEYCNTVAGAPQPPATCPSP